MPHEKNAENPSEEATIPPVAARAPEQEYIYVAKVNQPSKGGWLRVEDFQVNAMLTYRLTLPASKLPDGAVIVTPAEVEAW